MLLKEKTGKRRKEIKKKREREREREKASASGIITWAIMCVIGLHRTHNIGII